METIKNTDEDKQTLNITDRDVLGLEKNKGIITGPKAKPNRIFIVIAILLVLAAIYWWITK
ncbi:MAG: hypothetical protein V4580_05285 [Bacteroidota bacterium]